MSDGGAQVKKLRVQGKHVNWAVGGALAVVGALALAFVISVLIPRQTDVSALEAKLADQTKAAQELRDKLSDANSDVMHLQSKVKSVSASLGGVTEYANRLKRFTHLSDPDRNLALGPLVAKGEDGDDTALAIDHNEVEGIDQPAYERRKMRTGIMDRKFAALGAEADETQKKLLILEARFKDRPAVLYSAR